jgi:hypothetical protein
MQGSSGRYFPKPSFSSYGPDLTQFPFFPHERMNPSGRIEIHGAGVGGLGEQDIEKRAAEIARMDGRSHVHAADRSQAREELLHSGPPAAPEGDEEVRHWSEAAGSTGHQVPRVLPDDEVSPVEQLINEGLEEAERDLRLSASENQNSD